MKSKIKNLSTSSLNDVVTEFSILRDNPITIERITKRHISNDVFSICLVFKNESKSFEVKSMIDLNDDLSFFKMSPLELRSMISDWSVDTQLLFVNYTIGDIGNLKYLDLEFGLTIAKLESEVSKLAAKFQTIFDTYLFNNAFEFVLNPANLSLSEVVLSASFDDSDLLDFDYIATNGDIRTVQLLTIDSNGVISALFENQIVKLKFKDVCFDSNKLEILHLMHISQ